MAHISDGSGGGKRDLNPEVNLVPFIDLLSVCICFLLISAVWLQVGSVQVKQSHGTSAPDSKADTFELTAKFNDATHIDLIVSQGRKRIVTSVIKTDNEEDFGEKLKVEIQAAVLSVMRSKSVNPEQKVEEVITSGIIIPSKKAPYKSLISVMDALRKEKIVNLAVMPRAG